MDLSDLLDFEELLIDAIITRPQYPFIVRPDTPPADEINPGDMPVVVYPVFAPEPVDSDIARLNVMVLSLWRADDEGLIRLIVSDAPELDRLSLADAQQLAATTAFVYVLGPGYGILRDDRAVVAQLKPQVRTHR